MHWCSLVGKMFTPPVYRQVDWIYFPAKQDSPPRNSPPQHSPPQHSYEGAGYEGAGYEWAGYVVAGKKYH